MLDLAGDAFAIHADGSRFQLAKGDAVYEGDVIETGGAGSAIRMVFTDKTEFSLGTDARLALDQLVFNPDTQSGSSQFSVLKGVFIFASGEIAKTDNTHMTVITPVATIGIRGTEVAGHVSATDSQFTIIHGAIEVTTRAGSVTLDDHGETTHVTGIDTAPSNPAVLSSTQFDHAYGDVAGVVSNYFNATQPDLQSPTPGGDGAPAAPGESSPGGSGDHTDAGGAPGGTLLASALPSDTANPVPIASPLATDPLAPSVTALSDVATASGILAGAPAAGDQTLGAAASFLALPVVGGAPSGADAGAGSETVVAAIPGIDLANGLTFSGPAGAPAGHAGFAFAPSDGAAGAGVVGGPVQVSFTPVAVGAGDGGSVVSDVGHAIGSAPLNVPSSGSSGSPFRSESGTGDPFAANPYITHPFGYTGPQVGDPIFNLVSGGSDAHDSAANAAAADSSDRIVSTPGGQSSDTALVHEPTPDPQPQPEPDPANITLTVSNATTNETYQDRSHSFELGNNGTPSEVDIPGSEMHIPGVVDSASIHLERDGHGNVDVTLTSAWDSIKNIYAESATAADITIKNFVHADVTFGNGGDSHITIDDAKRGFITTGNGNDTVEINAYSNGVGWSNTFNVHTGAGDDVLIFNGASNGLSQLTFDGGDGTDTLKLSGAGQSFTLGSGQIQLSNVERVDISGVGDTTLTVSSSLFGSSNTNSGRTLIVDGDAGDTLHLQGDGWHQSGTTQIDGHGYTVYEHGQGTATMQIAAENGMHVT